MPYIIALKRLKPSKRKILLDLASVPQDVTPSRFDVASGKPHIPHMNTVHGEPLVPRTKRKADSTNDSKRTEQGPEVQVPLVRVPLVTSVATVPLAPRTKRKSDAESKKKKKAQEKDSEVDLSDAVQSFRM